MAHLKAILLGSLLLLGPLRAVPVPVTNPPSVRFTDVTEEAGLLAPNVFGGIDVKKYILESTGAGAAFVDYNNDGLVDIFLVNGTRLEGFPPGQEPSSLLFRNNGDGTFADVTDRAGLRRTGWGQGVCAGDYDNDGHDDLFVTYYGQNVFYRNRGDGTFEDVTGAAGLASREVRWGAGCAFLDYDRDGQLDLFVANYVDFDLETAPLPGSRPGFCEWKGVPVYCGPQGLKGALNVLYRNRGDGAFEDVSAKAGILRTDKDYFGLGVAVSDFDNDGWPDIFVACDSTANLLYRNRQDGTFEEIALLAGVAYNQDGREQAGMGAGVGDYDRNGFFDLIQTNFSDDTPTLYHNEGGATFTDRTLRARLGIHTRFLGWGTGFFDFDNDGWKDIFISNGHVYPEVDTHGMDTGYRQRKLLFRNLANGTFEDVSARAGEALLVKRAGRGAAFGDYDNDGDVDILVNNMNDLPSLLRNDGGNRNHWLLVKAVGTRSNRSGIGARVTLYYGNERQTDEVRSGGSWASQNDLRIHFGLGAAERVDRLEIRWASGLVENIRDVRANQTVVIREGAGKAEGSARQ